MNLGNTINQNNIRIDKIRNEIKYVSIQKNQKEKGLEYRIKNIPFLSGRKMSPKINRERRKQRASHTNLEAPCNCQMIKLSAKSLLSK